MPTGWGALGLLLKATISRRTGRSGVDPMVARFGAFRPSMIARALVAALIVSGAIPIACASAQSSPASAASSLPRSNRAGATASPVDLLPTSVTMRAKHAIRLRRAGSARPRWAKLCSSIRATRMSREARSCHGPGSRYATEMAKAMGKGHKPDQVGHGPCAPQKYMDRHAARAIGLYSW